MIKNISSIIEVYIQPEVPFQPMFLVSLLKMTTELKFLMCFELSSNKN